MQQANIILDKHYVIDRIDPRIYGSFVEHLGRCVYGGIYEPGHPSADEEGLRGDVLALVRQLNVPVVRYPGGNFVSGFRWEDSVGPRAERPARLDLAWNTTEPNAFGMQEFVHWCRKAGSAPMYSINLGTRGVQEAQDVVEYANHPGGTRLSDLRRAHGAEAPSDIKLWCLGNEMDGPWQTGHKTAREYGRLANEAGKVMKWVDPSIELVACGSSSSEMPTFGSWEREVLEECYDTVDYISLHRYYGNPTGDTPGFLARSMDMDAFIKSVAAICDSVGAQRHSRKKINLSFDEWNVGYHSNPQDNDIHQREPWGTGLHLLEDVYNFEDALLVGSILMTLIRNADRVKIACMAQLVNVIAPIMTENGGAAWAQTIFYPFLHASAYGRGTALRALVQSPCYDCADYHDVPYLDAAAVQGDDGTVTVFCVNRHPEETFALQLEAHAFGGLKLEEHIVLHHDDVKAVNTAANPENVVPVHVPVTDDVTIPALSWNVLRFAAE